MGRRDQGAYVVLAGPDGTGKSTLAEGLLRLDKRLHHRHWRPGLVPSLKKLRGGATDEGINSQPHARTPDSSVKATIRTVYYWTDFVLGYWLLIRPRTRRGDVFLLERGWEDVTIDPHRYGLIGAGLARWLMRLAPRPDLTIVLDVDPAVAHQRKPEITVREVERQLNDWAASRWARTVRTIDSGQDPDEVLHDARALIRSKAGS